MVEILKPNDYKKIIEGLYELNDEMDIMQYLESCHAKYAEDNYHFSAIFSQKISEIDDYDTTEDVQKYYYNKAINDPYCKIVLYIDAPNAVIRFAKVYIDYLAYCDDLVYPNDITNEETEDEIAEPRIFVSDLDKTNLKKVYHYLVTNGLLKADSFDHFLTLFYNNGLGVDIQKKIKWTLKYQNRFNSNLPMITLFRYIGPYKDNINEFYGEERKEFIETILQNIASASERYPFNPKSLNNSINDWIGRIEVHKGRRKPSPDIQPLDQESINIITFIESLS